MCLSYASLRFRISALVGFLAKTHNPFVVDGYTWSAVGSLNFDASSSALVISIGKSDVNAI